MLLERSINDKGQLRDHDIARKHREDKALLVS